MLTGAAETALPVPAVSGVDAVNGPEDETMDWSSINWRRVEDDVRRLRQRIFTASQAGDLAKVRNLQKLMLRSRGNTLASVRRVTEVNAGRTTAGIDGKTALLPQHKAELADWMQHRAGPWKPKPVKRVYIAKSNGKQRPLGVPVIADSSARWNPNGRRDLGRDPTDFVPVAAVMTRSWPSTPWRAVRTPNACGCSTPT